MVERRLLLICRSFVLLLVDDRAGHGARDRVEVAQQVHYVLVRLLLLMLLMLLMLISCDLASIRGVLRLWLHDVIRTSLYMVKLLRRRLLLLISVRFGPLSPASFWVIASRLLRVQIA